MVTPVGAKEGSQALNRIHAMQRKPLALIPDDQNDRAFKIQSARIDRINFQIESFRSSELLREATKLDIKIPVGGTCNFSE
jgi:hypothetical protein